MITIIIVEVTHHDPLVIAPLIQEIEARLILIENLVQTLLDHLRAVTLATAAAGMMEEEILIVEEETETAAGRTTAAIVVATLQAAQTPIREVPVQILIAAILALLIEALLEEGQEEILIHHQ